MTNNTEKTYTGTYKVMKLFRVSRRREVLRRGLTIEEAKRVVNSYPDSSRSMVVFTKQFFADKYFIQTKQLTRLPELDNFARELKENGFIVLISTGYSNLPTWLHFWKDGKLGYVQGNYYTGYDFSTTHKPCKDYGTGFSVLQETALTIENANKALVKIPYTWAGKNRNSNTKGIEFYESPEEFINTPLNESAKYYIL